MIVRTDRAAIALALALSLSACATTDTNVRNFEQTVTAVQTDETADVPALVLARGMAEAGFTRSQILENGPAIRNALAQSGGAQIADGSNVLAIISVLDGQLFVVSNETCTTVIPVNGAGTDQPLH